MRYESPKVTELGSVDALTLTNIYKTTGAGDVIVYNGVDEPVTGKQVTHISS